VGLILSLMWWDPALSAHVGEKRSAMGDVNSKTIAYAKRYVSIILEHFADRRCIWGWEIGNEYNLTADLCDPAYKKYLWPDRYEQMPHSRVNGYDFYTSEELQVFFREIASMMLIASFLVVMVRCAPVRMHYIWLHRKKTRLHISGSCPLHRSAQEIHKRISTR